jgi:putative intracellular protease/amidase
VAAEDFDALLLPGGVANPDKLRTIPAAVKFVSSFASEGKPIAAICHGPWMLVESGAVKGATVTSWPSLKTSAMWSAPRNRRKMGTFTPSSGPELPALRENRRWTVLTITTCF